MQLQCTYSLRWTQSLPHSKLYVKQNVKWSFSLFSFHCLHSRSNRTDSQCIRVCSRAICSLSTNFSISLSLCLSDRTDRCARLVKFIIYLHCFLMLFRFLVCAFFWSFASLRSRTELSIASNNGKRNCTKLFEYIKLHWMCFCRLFSRSRNCSRIQSFARIYKSIPKNAKSKINLLQTNKSTLYWCIERKVSM